MKGRRKESLYERSIGSHDEMGLILVLVIDLDVESGEKVIDADMICNRLKIEAFIVGLYGQKGLTIVFNIVDVGMVAVRTSVNKDVMAVGLIVENENHKGLEDFRCMEKVVCQKGL